MEAALALWGNTTLGLLLHWWQASKQQAGRGNVGKQALAKFVMLDPTGLSTPQLLASAELLKSRASIPMRPFNEIDLDEARADLDRQFLVDILGLPGSMCAANGAFELLRSKLAAEPSIAGSKKRSS